MDDQEPKTDAGRRLLAIEAVVSALAKRASADPAFATQVTLAVVETTYGMSADTAARVNALARRIVGDR